MITPLGRFNACFAQFYFKYSVLPIKFPICTLNPLNHNKYNGHN